jgi:hypothetical protein
VGEVGTQTDQLRIVLVDREAHHIALDPKAWRLPAIKNSIVRG